MNLSALNRFKDDLQLYWSGQARRACHANIIALHYLADAYDQSPDELAPRSLAKYGVEFLCPEGGSYSVQPEGLIACSVHGNRRHSCQNLAHVEHSVFANLRNEIDAIDASLRFDEDRLRIRVQIARTQRTGAVDSD